MNHYDKDAEIAVIASMMADNANIPRCVEILNQGDAFVFSPNRILYLAMKSLWENGKPCDVVSVANQVELNGDLTRIGGREYIADIAIFDAVPENLEYYAKLVHELFVRRQLSACAPKIQQIANEDLTVDEMQSNAQELISSLSTGFDKEVGIKEQADKAHERLMQMSEGNHIELSTGFSNLDLMLSGLQKKKYYLIAGLPSVGKSSFAHNILYHVAVELQRPAALFCYESDAASVILRMVSANTGIDLFENAHKTKNNAEVVNVFSKIQKSPLIILDDMPFSVEYAVAKAQRLKVEHPDLSLIVFDHLHEMTADVGKYGNQESVVSTISGNLKRLAKIIDIPVLALCQMSRASIKQQNPRPMLNDLRASGALEFGADVVVFIYRDDYYEQATPSPISETEIIIRKNRDGPVGTLKYQYYRAISKFEEI